MMGLMRADILMENSRLPKARAAKVRVLVDSGAVNLCIPAKLCTRLKLEVLDVNPDNPDMAGAIVKNTTSATGAEGAL